MTPKNTVAAATLSFVVAAFIVASIVGTKARFDRTVSQTRETSEGYDQILIDKVNQLESVLATRAQFGYSGGKDPMTGRIRQVVVQRPAQVPAPLPRPVANASAPGLPPPPPLPVERPDPVRLTAIIADSQGQKTAIIMDGERSYAVAEGDRVAGRRVVSVAPDMVVMVDDTTRYLYDIHGGRRKTPRTSVE